MYKIRLYIYKIFLKLTMRDRRRIPKVERLGIYNPRNDPKIVDELKVRLKGTGFEILEFTRIFEYRRFDFVLIANYVSFFHLIWISTTKNSLLVDREFYSTVGDNNIARIRSILNVDSVKVQSIEFSFHSKDSVTIFATGPSIGELKIDSSIRNSVKIGCNSIIKDREFYDAIGGFDYICFADPVYHFGNNKYVDKFYCDLDIYLEMFPKTWLVVPDFARFFVEQKLRNPSKIIPVTIDPLQDDLVCPSHSGISVQGSENILTLIMMPLASLFELPINVAGVVGTSKDTNANFRSNSRFWSHNERFQYTELMKNVEKHHPAFFRDRNYENYRERHEIVLRNMCDELKMRGLNIRSLTFTYFEFLK